MCYYALAIFRRARLPAFNRYQLTVIQQLMYSVGYLSSAPITARMRRRRQYVMSAVLTASSMGMLGACLAIKEVTAAACAAR